MSWRTPGTMKLKESKFNTEANVSKLRLYSILGVFCLVLGTKDLLAWAVIIDPESGWLIQLTGAKSLQPICGLILALLGAGLTGPTLMQCFSVRDTDRKKARRAAALAALVCGAGMVYALETLLPSRESFRAEHSLNRDTRRAGLAGLFVAGAGLVGFVLMRRRDVGFWTTTIPLSRDNEIWRLSVKVEVAFRALPENEEAYRMVGQ